MSIYILWIDICLFTFWLAVKVKREAFYSVNVAYEVESSQTFGNMSSIVSAINEDDSIQKVNIRSSDDKFNVIVGLNARYHYVNSFPFFNVIYEINECRKNI